jgi:hypothetical protein
VLARTHSNLPYPTTTLLRKTNHSSRRRGGPISEHIHCLATNKHLVMSLDKTAAIHCRALLCYDRKIKIRRHSYDSSGATRQKNMVMVPAEPGMRNDCAGEGLQQFIRQTGLEPSSTETEERIPVIERRCQATTT